MKNITCEQLHKLLNYDPGTGNLIWKESRHPCIKIGDIAGYLGNTGYYYIGRLFGKVYLTHRLVWLWHKGYFPENDIDHINKTKTDNRIDNLREVSRRCNMRNCGNPKDNTSGVKGVTWSKKDKKWQAQLTSNYKHHNLGRYKDFDEAVLARLAAEQCLDWESCDSTSPAYQYAINNGLIKC